MERVRRIGTFTFVVVAMLAILQSSALATTTEDGASSTMLAKINAARTSSAHKLTAVKGWSVIVTEAAKHSAYQAQQGRISHDGFDARAKRIMASGSGINSVCENVGYVSGVSSAADAMNIIYRGWDASAPHHACMFDTNQHGVWAGVGVKQIGTTWYATFIAVQDVSPSKP